MEDTHIAEKLCIGSNDCLRKLCSSKISKTLIYEAIDSESEYYSKEFCQAVLSDDYETAKRLLGTKQWDSKFWEPYKDNENKRREVKVKRAANTSIPCKKCHAETVNVTLVQKRAADEGATQCFECFSCGHCWQKS